MTIIEKIMSSYSSSAAVCPGDILRIEPDMVVINNDKGDEVIKEFEIKGDNVVKYPERVVMVLDHGVPSCSIQTSDSSKRFYDFAKKHGINHVFQPGKGGIGHVFLPEIGMVYSGGFCAGTSEYICTFGALGCFTIYCDPKSMAGVLVSGEMLIKVPETIRINLYGSPADNILGKDIILYLTERLGTDGAVGRVLEFGGPGLAYLSMDDRFTIANMSVGTGAVGCVFEVDDITRAYMVGHCRKNEPELATSKNGYIRIFLPDSEAVYSQVENVILDGIEACVKLPEEEFKILNPRDIKRTKVDQVVIGGCSNGRLSDLRIAAEVLRNNSLAEGIRLVIIPGSINIYRQAVKEGLIELFTDIGAVLVVPSCGACHRGYLGMLAEGEICVSTTNKNFAGCMGHINSRVFLADSYIAAKAAINGFIGDA